MLLFLEVLWELETMFQHNGLLRCVSIGPQSTRILVVDLGVMTSVMKSLKLSEIWV